MDTATKRGGRRLHSALSDRAVKAATAPGRMFDGQGLFLLVTPGGAKIWKQRIAVNGRRQELGLGPYPVVTLREAREAALANRRMVRAGMNPKVERCRARGIPTFAELARADFEHRKGGWRSAKHAHDWNATLERFVFPRLGDRTVDAITTDDVFRVLAPIWHTKPTTAKLVRQRISAVFAVAVAKGHRTDNPADTVKAMLAKHQSVETKGHRSLPYGDVAGALAKVRESKAHRSTVLALEFLVLTAARAGEVRFATWNEIDIGRVDLDGARRAHEGRARAPRPAVGACGRNPRRSAGGRERSHRPDIPRTRRPGARRAVHACRCSTDSASMRRRTASGRASAYGRRNEPPSRAKSAKRRSRTPSPTRPKRPISVRICSTIAAT